MPIHVSLLKMVDSEWVGVTRWRRQAPRDCSAGVGIRLRRLCTVRRKGISHVSGADHFAMSCLGAKPDTFLSGCARLRSRAGMKIVVGRDVRVCFRDGSYVRPTAVRVMKSRRGWTADTQLACCAESCGWSNLREVHASSVLADWVGEPRGRRSYVVQRLVQPNGRPRIVVPN